MWTKSSLCKTDSDMCVEVYGLDAEFVSIRDSKNPTKVVSFTREEWQTFIDGVKAGDFDLKVDTSADAEEQLEQV